MLRICRRRSNSYIQGPITLREGTLSLSLLRLVCYGRSPWRMGKLYQRSCKRQKCLCNTRVVEVLKSAPFPTFISRIPGQGFRLARIQVIRTRSRVFDKSANRGFFFCELKKVCSLQLSIALYTFSFSAQDNKIASRIGARQIHLYLNPPQTCTDSSQN